MLVIILDAGADIEEGWGLAGEWAVFHSWPTLCCSLKVSNWSSLYDLGIMQMKTCRVGHPEDLVIAVKKDSDKFLTKNVVYREVLLHRRCLPPTSHLQPASSPSAAVVVSAGQPDDHDYTGIYDGIEEGEEEEGADSRGEGTVRRTLPAPVPALPSLSHPLPPNVTLALPPTAREAEVGKYVGILTFGI